jgi:hypothetical protein
MAERKQTPDVLAEILGGEVAVPEPGAPLPVGKITDLPRRRTIARPAERAPKPKPEAVVAAPAPEIQWEYEVVSFQEYHGWRPRFVNGRELAKWMNGPLIHDYINQRSAEGWELAAVASGQSMYGTNDRYQIYFRRLRRQS